MKEIHPIEDHLRSEAAHSAPPPSGPSRLILLAIALLLVVLVVAGFFAGYLPRRRRESVLAAETKIAVDTLPVVNVQIVRRAEAKSSLVLPGNIQAVMEAPVLARASGYIKRRYADIGDRVKEGQVLAEIEAPELNQQIRQAKATVDQANSTIEQAQAALQQGRSNENLARVTAQRWENLSKKGVVSRQEDDTYQAQWAAQQANVQALEKAVSAARNNAAAVEANVARLNDLLAYQTVRAPFAGVITLRNVDEGVLVNEGNTLLFRIAQTDRLRTYLNVPQSDAGSVRVGQQAVLVIPDLPGHGFPGAVTRTANALDLATRTLLVEVQVPNPAALLMPGMYAQVRFSTGRAEAAVIVPGDVLILGRQGPRVAVVAPDHRIHLRQIRIGQDLGSEIEVVSGLAAGEVVVANPSDAVRENALVEVRNIGK